MTQSSVAGDIHHPLSPERRAQLDVHRILSLLPLRPYLTVADVGCGPGLFAIPLAKALWGGKLYALDLREEMLEAVRQRAKEARLGNIVTLRMEETTLPLEQGTMNGALLACVLHEVSDRAAFLKAVLETLGRSAWCAVIEWRGDAGGDEGPPPERRIAEEEVLRLAREVGLRATLRRELSSYHYMILLNK